MNQVILIHMEMAWQLARAHGIHVNAVALGRQKSQQLDTLCDEWMNAQQLHGVDISPDFEAKTRNFFRGFPVIRNWPEPGIWMGNFEEAPGHVVIVKGVPDQMFPMYFLMPPQQKPPE